MVKIFHEAPNQVFSTVQRYTDGDYALVHLMDENPWYRELMTKAVQDGREVILDNSIFELGTSFNARKFASWVENLKPTWYIIPDVLENCHSTIMSFEKFKAEYSNLPGSAIAVAQGSTLFEMMYCFEYLHNDPFVKMVALSFDLSFYETLLDTIFEGENLEMTQLEKWVLGRHHIIKLLDTYYQLGIFYKPVHLLGCALPQEGDLYKDIDWIYSTDTSNPVVAGMEGILYGNHGLTTKSKTKLFTIIDNDVNYDQTQDIVYNIKAFRKLWHQPSIG